MTWYGLIGRQGMDTFARYKNIPEYITDLSRENRRKPTSQEEKLWEYISKRRLAGEKFRRQFPMGRYIVDFYNHAHKLVIEIDGEIHKSRKEYDRNRDEYLKGCGCTVVRFTNNEIDTGLDSVLQKIVEYLK
ncbi:MAG: endonuclease domain-containing protein [Chitinispirillaceae bacterium]|nr:endonuclease domain-containing protein [Chitinispirillaceae bacterium]